MGSPYIFFKQWALPSQVSTFDRGCLPRFEDLRIFMKIQKMEHFHEDGKIFELKS